jgi:hypothetical protein
MGFEISPDVWRKIYKENKNGLVGKWTNVLYDAVCAQDAGCCPLTFKLNRIKKQFTQKYCIDFFTAHARCMYPSCHRFFKFVMRTKPPSGRPVHMLVAVTGDKIHPSG